MITIKNLRYQKISAIIIAILIAILSVNSYQSNALVNTQQTYQVYNAENGIALRTYTLSPVSSNNNTRIATPIGEDERVIDWTKSGVCKIMTDTFWAGTGFVVDDHTIATAAHCLYDTTNDKGRIIPEILLFDQNGNITLHATPVEYHIPVNFSNYSNNNYDYALITIEEDLSTYDFFDFGVMMNGFIGNAVSLTGFPQIVRGDVVNDTSEHKMYTGNGVITSNVNSNYRISYSNDNTEGNSGGPVYVTNSYYGTTYYTVIAINTHHATAYNLGTRINTNLLHFYNNNPNLIY